MSPIAVGITVAVIVLIIAIGGFIAWYFITREVPCSADTSCSTGNICVTGKCIAGCRVDTNCPDGQICTGNVCVPKPCTVNADCPKTKTCTNGKCSDIFKTGDKVVITSVNGKIKFGSCDGFIVTEATTELIVTANADNTYSFKTSTGDVMYYTPYTLKIRLDSNFRSTAGDVDRFLIERGGKGYNITTPSGIKLYRAVYPGICYLQPLSHPIMVKTTSTDYPDPDDSEFNFLLSS